MEDVELSLEADIIILSIKKVVMIGRCINGGRTINYVGIIDGNEENMYRDVDTKK